VQEGLVRGLLGDEAEQRGDPRHREGGQRRDHGQHREAARQPGQQAQVTGAGLVVDDADGEEQRGLEQAVREQQRRAGQRRLARARPEQHEQEAELADGPEGEQALEIVLPKSAPSADDHREQADGEHDRPPGADQGEGRRQPRHQVDAGLDHRRRVQVRRHRGGRGHGGRQPRVERHLGALGEGPDQDQQQRQRNGAARGRVGQDLRERGRAGRLPEQDEADEHRQPAQGRHEQRLLGGPAALRLLVVEADQQVRRDAGELPEDVQQDQVVGQDEAEHRAGEGGEDTGEPAEATAVGREVPGAVEEDQRPDSGHQRDHQQREGVEPQVERQPQAGHPGRRRGDRGAVEDPARLRRGPDGGGGRSEGHQKEDVAAEPSAGSRRDQRQRQVHGQQGEQGTSGVGSGRDLVARTLHEDADQASRLTGDHLTGRPGPRTRG
jgi:hypothetical protein